MSSNSCSSTVVLEGEPPRRNLCGCAGLNRFGILALGVVYFSVLMSTMIAFNATFVPMMDKTTSPLYNGSNANDSSVDWESSELSIADRRYSYGFLEKSLSFSGGYCGSMLATFPVNYLLTKYGAHKVLTVIGVISTVVCFIHPFVIAWSFPVFVVTRVFAGVSISNLFPVIGILVNEWAPVEEKGLFVAVLSAFVEMSSIFTMPVSGVLAVKVSWPSVFYVHSGMCAVMTVLWAIYYRDQPRKHPFVADKEWRKISHGKAPAPKKVVHPVLRIMKSISIWAVWVAVVGNFLVSQFSISFSPLYLKYVLGYEPLIAGFIIMVPLLCLLVIKLLTGLLSDRIHFISELNKLKLFNSVACVGAGLFFIVLALRVPFNHSLDLFLVGIPIVLLGFSVGGYPKSAVMVARQHSPFVMSIVQIVAMCSLMVGSFVVPAITVGDTFEQWRVVFMIYAAVLVFSNTIFIGLARAEPAKWSQSDVVPSTASTAVETHVTSPSSSASTLPV